ncbi:MAG: adenosylmethionine decarboxylase [Candidatus Cloacimonetes bacterium]|nr:adenosylmethionine decarboxylase [Candidatus Cloacimonadota bacterium]
MHEKLTKQFRFELGHHVMAELSQCANVEILSQSVLLLRAMTTAAEEAGLTVVHCQHYQFEPVGGSAVLLLSESHFSAHTWPEQATVAIDVFTCSDPTKAMNCVRVFSEILKAQSVQLQQIPRGIYG